MVNAVTRIIMSRIPSIATGTDTVVFHIPESVATHNIMLEVLKHIRQEHPGVWYCAQEWERQERKAALATVGGKVKAVTAAHMGLGDVPV